jgi:hypothetical protein
MNNWIVVLIAVAAAVLIVGIPADWGVEHGPVAVTAKSGLEVRHATWRIVRGQDRIRVSGEIVNGSPQDTMADLRVAVYSKDGVEGYPSGLLFFVQRFLPSQFGRFVLDLFSKEASLLDRDAYVTSCLPVGGSQTFERELDVAPTKVGQVAVIAAARRTGCMAFPTMVIGEPCVTVIGGEAPVEPRGPAVVIETEKVTEPEPTLPPSPAEEGGACQVSVILERLELVHNNHVGDDWSFNLEVNGEEIPISRFVSSKTIYKASFHEPMDLTVVANAQEQDTRPDFGSGRHVFRLDCPSLSGESLTAVLDVSVRENAGRYSGNTALWRFYARLEIVSE